MTQKSPQQLKVERFLGEGAFGRVYLVSDPDLKKWALKVLKISFEVSENE